MPKVAEAVREERAVVAKAVVARAGKAVGKAAKGAGNKERAVPKATKVVVSRGRAEGQVIRVVVKEKAALRGKAAVDQVARKAEEADPKAVAVVEQKVAVEHREERKGAVVEVPKAAARQVVDVAAAVRPVVEDEADQAAEMPVEEEGRAVAVQDSRAAVAEQKVEAVEMVRRVDAAAAVPVLEAADKQRGEGHVVAVAVADLPGVVAEEGPEVVVRAEVAVEAVVVGLKRVSIGFQQNVERL